MGKLIYTAIASLDGYIADAKGHFDWSAPDEEVHGFINNLERGIGTYLYGRKMYEIMRFWEPLYGVPGQLKITEEYAEVWHSAKKIVFSSTLSEPLTTAQTTLYRDFTPAKIQKLKDTEVADISVGGALLASQAFAAGLVDELNLFLSPVIIGSGTKGLPTGDKIQLELMGQRNFSNGVVHLQYRVKN